MVPVSLVTLLAVATPHALRATPMLRRAAALQTTDDGHLYLYVSSNCSGQSTEVMNFLTCTLFNGGSAQIDFGSSCSGTSTGLSLKYYPTSTNCTGTPQTTSVESSTNCTAAGDVSVQLVLPQNLPAEATCELTSIYQKMVVMSSAVLTLERWRGTTCTGTPAYADTEALNITGEDDACESCCPDVAGMYDTVLVACSGNSLVFAVEEYSDSTCQQEVATDIFRVNTCSTRTINDETFSVKATVPYAVTDAFCSLASFQEEYSVKIVSMIVSPDEMKTRVPATAALLDESASHGAVPLLLLLSVAVIQTLVL